MARFSFIGQFLGDTGRVVESAESYLKAAKLAPMDFEIIFNTANALRFKDYELKSLFKY